MTEVFLRQVACYLPPQACTNEDLAALNPTWDADKIFAKTGIRQRPVAGAQETASDLAYRAAEKLLETSAIPREEIDGLLFCTQSPDYFLPTSACLLQARLGLSTSCAAFDYNLGCSGFTYGLWMARALVASQSARHVLLLGADTFTRYCDPHDLTTVTIFADAGSAALVSASGEGALGRIGPTVLGTDGRGGENLIVRAGCGRAWAQASCDFAAPATVEPPRLEMNGPEVFSFTLREVEPAIAQLLLQLGWSWDSVDLFLLHQANAYMLQQLRKKLNVPAEKLPIDLAECGNTVSATIPVLMCRLLDSEKLKPNQRCILAGYGVGYSWAITSLETL